MAYLLPLYFSIIFAFEIRALLTKVLEEKEARLQEALLVAGLPAWVDALAWTVAAFVRRETQEFVQNAHML